MHHPLMAASPDSPPRVLLTGVTGYVGSRLLPRLVAAGYPMRAVTRRPVTDGNLAVEYVVADVLNELSLTQAMTGCKAAFYLIHSLGVGGDFEEEERRCAASFGRAARAAGIERIIYLGGLGDSGDALSPHLRSRQRVGAILAESGVPVIEFRASVIIGSGSLSFEMIRALVERLPVMITPRWVSVIAQPIAIDDVLQYLVAGVSCPVGSTHRIYEIGGAEQISYGGLMRTYAELRGLRRLFLPVPVLTPNLSSLWLRLVTPLLASVGRKLIESIRHPTIVRDPGARNEFNVRAKGVREAMATALADEDNVLAALRWAEAAAPAKGRVNFGNRDHRRWLFDARSVRLPITPEQAFRPIRRIGGKTGWYYANWLWTFRGWLDRLQGGVGMSRGREDADQLQPGDIIDCWRVDLYEPNRHLRLVAEMKLPGRAWLDFEIATDDRGTRIHQTAIFDPHGFLGILYWFVVTPLHKVLFPGMLRGIAKAAVEQ